MQAIQSNTCFHSGANFCELLSTRRAYICFCDYNFFLFRSILRLLLPLSFPFAALLLPDFDCSFHCFHTFVTRFLCHGLLRRSAQSLNIPNICTKCYLPNFVKTNNAKQHILLNSFSENTGNCWKIDFCRTLV